MKKIIYFLVSLLVRLNPEFKYEMIAKGDMFFLQFVSKEDKKAIAALESCGNVQFIVGALFELFQWQNRSHFFKNVVEYALDINPKNSQLRYQVLIGIMKKLVEIERDCMMVGKPMWIVEEVVAAELSNGLIESSYVHFYEEGDIQFVIQKEDELYRVAYYHITKEDLPDDSAEKKFWSWCIIYNYADTYFPTDIDHSMLVFAIRELMSSQMESLYYEIPTQPYYQDLVNRVFGA